ncbi:MAG: PUA domain-containing protein [Candidatus Helarchaeota archaeon]
MEILSNSSQYYFYMRKFIALLKFQYYIDDVSIDFFKNLNLSFIFSKNTGRLKYIKSNGKIIATFRAHDGFLVLTKFGATIIKNLIEYPKLRVVIPNEISEFIAKGRNVFSKHVIEIDQELRPESEVLIVDQTDKLVGIGKLIMSPVDVKKFKTGVAVKVR